MFMHTTLKLRPKSAIVAKDHNLAVSLGLLKVVWHEFTPVFSGYDSLDIELGDDAGTWCWTQDGSHVDDDEPIGIPFIYVTIASLLDKSCEREAMVAVDDMFRRFEDLLSHANLLSSDFCVESYSHVDPSTELVVYNE